MLIKSPLKKEKVKRNRRSKSNGKKTVRPGNRIRSNGENHGQPINPKKKKKRESLFSIIKPWKVILGAVVLGGLGFLYLSHVFATQELLQEVNRLERQYNQVKRTHSHYRLTYDRMIGPAEIYEEAKKLGLIDGGPAEKIIEVKK